MTSPRVFVTGGTCYMGQRLMKKLIASGYDVTAVVRAGSESKLPAGCLAVTGNVLDGNSYASHVASGDTFVQLVGVAHPSPAKAVEFVEIDQTSALEAIRVARDAGVRHFVYVSVAHPAPAMHAYVAVREKCEAAIHEASLHATILRPWYVLGPGHHWPRLLIPLYWLADRLPSTRDGARRLGLVTIDQMVTALVRAVANPPQGINIVDVPGIRSCSI
jgi:uncharacterized protein YbjT (DUF2867 family)